MRGMRMVAAPLVVLLAVGTVSTTMLLNPQQTPDGQPSLESPLSVPSRGPTRSLSPTNTAPTETQSEDRLQWEIKVLETALGAGHPDVADLLERLATLYQAQRRYGDAEPLFRRVLAIRERADGRTGRNVARTLDRLAATLRAQGRGQEADELARRAAAISQNLPPR
jgi:hypothetical protein